MLPRDLRAWSRLLVVLVLPAGLLLPELAAQGPLQPAPGQEGLVGGLADKLNTKDNTRFNELRDGKKPVSESKEKQDNDAVLAKQARWYAHKLTNPNYHEKERNPEKEAPNDVVKHAYQSLLLPPPELRATKKAVPPTPVQQEYLKAFTKELTASMREVLSKNGKLIVRVNAARILAGVAEAGQEDVADTLVTIVNNPNENDGVKLYALRGLVELFKQGTPAKSVFQNADREVKCITALQKFVARPRPEYLAPDAPPDEVAALQYVRREAVRGLAASRYPALPKREKDLEAATALWLARVVSKSGFDPEPSLTEQAEAAIGLCQMQLKLNKDYQPDYAAQVIGNFLLDYIKEYGAQRPTKTTTLPWKLYSVRLSLALDRLSEQAKEAPGKGVADYVNKFVTLAQKMLRPLEKDTDPPDLTELEKFLGETKPPSSQLFKGLKESVLKTTG